MGVKRDAAHMWKSRLHRERPLNPCITMNKYQEHKCIRQHQEEFPYLVTFVSLLSRQSSRTREASVSLCTQCIIVNNHSESKRVPWFLLEHIHATNLKENNYDSNFRSANIHPRGPGLFNWFMTVFSYKRSLGVRRFTSLDFDDVKVKGETNK